MKTMTRLTIAACSTVLLLSATAFAQQPAPMAAPPAAPAPTALRMAFVDLQRVAAESAEGKVANGKVQQLTQTKANDIAVKTKQLDAANQKLQQGGAVLNDATRATVQKDVDRLTVEIDRLQQDAQAEVQEFQQQQLGDFQEKLKPVVEALVKELGVGLLFSMGDAGAIFVDPSLDITPEVIKRFDAASAAKPAGPAAPATAAPKPATPPAAAAPKPATPPAAAAPKPPATTPAPAGRGAAPKP
jgi:outer membrane protein